MSSSSPTHAFFPEKIKVPFGNFQGVHQLTKPQLFWAKTHPLVPKIAISGLKRIYHSKYYYILRYFYVLHFASKVITFYEESYYILRYRRYYILRRKLLQFALLLHFVEKVITFCFTITFSVSYYILWRNKPFYKKTFATV